MMSDQMQAELKAGDTVEYVSLADNAALQAESIVLVEHKAA
jgi:hypothetical protein